MSKYLEFMAKMKRASRFLAPLNLSGWRTLAFRLVLALFVTMSAGEMQRESAHAKASEASAKAQPRRKSVAATLAVLPLSFEANQGQADQATKFLARGSGYTLLLASREAVLALRLPGHPERKQNIPANRSPSNRPSAKVPRSTALRMRLLGSNPTPHISGLDDLPGRTNYFIGNDPKKWRTNIPNYAKVRYESVYPGVDLVYYGNRGRLENDFIVAPGANPGTITLGFQGARGISLGPAGNLILHVRGGKVVLQRPRAYQRAGTRLDPVPAEFAIKGPDAVGFAVGSYDRVRPLVIDPVLSYSTYLGGGGIDEALGIAVDTSGNAYVTGFTTSTDFPTQGTPGPAQNANGGGQDAFVTKLDPNGGLLYSTYLGGSSTDQGNAIAVDVSGNAFVTGFTSSTNFPTTPGVFQTALKGTTTNAFVTKLGSTGSTLVYSTYLGGTGTSTTGDEAFGIAIDVSGNAYVTGSTASADFPTVNPLPTPNNALQGPSDAFVTKLNPTGTAPLIYSTYLGGTGSDQGNAIAVDVSSNAYVTGLTSSSSPSGNFPITSGAFQITLKAGATNAFVAKLNTNTTVSVSPVYCTYLGGSGTDLGLGIALDASRNAYVTGSTASADFPTMNPLPAPNNVLQGPSDAFVTKLNATGTAPLIYSTYLGGTGSDQGYAIAVDSSGNAYVTGFTNSSNFPIASPVQNANGGFDAFVTKLAFTVTPPALSLVYSTYLGGSGTDSGVGIAIDTLSLPNAYVTGFTESTDFPLLNPLPPPNNALQGFTDAFVAKISPANAPGVSLSKTSLTFAAQSIGTTSPAQTVVLRNVGSAGLTVTGITVSGDFAETNSCLIGVAAASSCTISVTFSPTQRNPQTGAVTINDNASGSPHTIGLSGNGAPAVTLSPGSLNFASQNIGTTSPTRTVTLTSSGVGPLTINGIVTSGDFAQTNKCPTTLLVGANCTISVIFTPTAALTRTGQLIIVDNVPDSPQTVQLSGTGFGPAATLSTPSLTFGEQPVGTTSGPQTVTLTNSGNAQMTISGFTVNGDFAQTNNCSGSLAAGKSCTLNVTFSPKSAGITFGAVTIADNAPGNPHVVALSGLSVAGPAAEVFLSPSNLSFGLQPVTMTTSAQAFTLRNTGNATLSINGVAVTGDFSQTTTPTSCGKQVSLGGNCTIDIAFTPTSAGPRAGTLTITDNATASPHTAILSGTGTDFALSSAQPNATVNAGQTATYNLTVAPVSGFNRQVSLACSGAPQAATCTISPAQVTLDGTNSQTVKVTVMTMARSLASPQVQGPRVVLPPWEGPKNLRWILALLALGVLAAGMTLRPVRRRAGLALAGVLFVLLWGACVVGSQKINGTLAGNYALTLTGTTPPGPGNVSLKHAVNIGLTVN